METNDVFTDQMKVCRPQFVELFGAFAVAVISDSCNIVCQSIQPYINNVFRIEVYRNTPFGYTASITMDYATQQLLRSVYGSLLEIGEFDLIISFANPMAGEDWTCLLYTSRCV